MTDYKLTRGSAVIRSSDGANIPPDPTNTDYAAYLGWLAAGGVPDPVDPPSKDELNAPILAQIAALDAYIPRGLEDLIAGLGFDVTKLPPEQQDRLEQKKALRLQLVK